MCITHTSHVYITYITSTARLSQAKDVEGKLAFDHAHEQCNARILQLLLAQPNARVIWPLTPDWLGEQAMHVMHVTYTRVIHSAMAPHAHHCLGAQSPCASRPSCHLPPAVTSNRRFSGPTSTNLST